jgi:hypothetical protein
VKFLPLLLSLAALPAFGALGPSIEVPVAPPVIGRAAETQGWPRVATDGRDFFAVWSDSRSGTRSVFGTRVLADGTVLDPTGILIAASGDVPGLVWDGANYVVVWRESSSSSYPDYRVSFVRIDRNGRVLGGPKPLVNHSLGVPSIASNGGGSAVIFSADSSHLALISQDGSVTNKTLSQSFGPSAQLASNGDGYLLAWTTNLNTYLLRLDNDGNPRAPLQWTEPMGDARLFAGIGGRYLMVGLKWGNDGSSCARSIVGRFGTSNGVSGPIVIHDAGGADLAGFTVAPDWNGFQVVWEKRLGVYPCSQISSPDPPTGPSLPFPPFGLAQTHFGQDGSSGTPSVVVEGSGYALQPSVARNSAAELLVWIERPYSGGRSKVAAAIVDPGGPVAPILIASSAAAQYYTGLAAAESTFMTAWSERDLFAEGSGIYARRFNSDGRALDAAPIMVSAHDPITNYAPRVSFDGAVWLFVWAADSKTVVRRMAGDGSWIDAAPLTIGTADYAVASNGNGFAVLSTPSPLKIVFIPRAGAPRALPVALPGLPRYPRYPSMAWDGNAYVAVWSVGSDEIEGIRLDQDGRIVTPLFSIAGKPHSNALPSIDCRGAMCAVAWQSDGAIAAASIVGGTVIPFNKMIGAADPNTHVRQPTVLATGGGFQLFWSEDGFDTPLLFTASITAGGIGSPSLLGASGFYGAAAAAVTTRGQLGLTLVHPANDPAYGGVVRAFLRILPEPTPEPGRRRAVR